MNDIQSYRDWLRNAVSKLCNTEGSYEVWWDHDEQVESSQVREAVQNYKRMGYASPQSYLERETFQEAADYHQRELLKEVEEMAEDAKEPVAREYRNAVDEGVIWDDLERAGFAGIDLMMESALRHSRIDANLLFATKEELNHDTCSIVEAFGSAYEYPQPATLNADALDNALSYLINQQGYSIADLYAALDEAMIETPFIQSIVEEVNMNSSEYTCCLAALIATDALTYIELCEMAGTEGHEIVLPKDDCTIGLFDKDMGGGSALGIAPERDVVMPTDLLFDIQVERAGGTMHEGYTVGQVYGLMSKAWRFSHEIREGTGHIETEDRAAVLEAMRLTLDAYKDSKASEADGRSAPEGAPGQKPQTPPAPMSER